jgi:hypothetical protein
VPRRSRVRVQHVRGLAPLLLVGPALILAGAAADLAFHLLAQPLSPTLAALIGANGVRAHLLTLIGMLVTVLGLVVQARAAASS